MRDYPIQPGEMLTSVWRNRRLVWQLTRREVVGRYRGSFLGIAWSLFNPLLMLTVYTFVFGVAFQARWHGGSGTKAEYAILLFAGLIIYGFFSECIGRAPGLVLANPNFVKKVVFPLEVLPWVALGAAAFHGMVSLGVLLLFSLAVNHALHWTVLLLPLVLLPLALLTLGLSWFLSSLGVYLRDVGHTIGVIVTLLMFLSPVFYPLSALPGRYRTLLALNPLSPIIEEARNILLFGRMPDLGSLGIVTAFAAALAWLGFAWFQKTRKGFGDVL